MTAAQPGVSAPAAHLLRGAGIVATALRTLAPAAVRAVGRPRPRRREVAIRALTDTVIALGPTFVKAAQVLGTRRDVLPPDLCAELSSLHDDVPAPPRAETDRALEAAFGEDLDELFADVDRTPLAAGSVASVHWACLHSGREVALKLRRPGIERVMDLDLHLLVRGAAVLAHLPPFRGVPVLPIVEHMADAVRGQLDFEREAQSLYELRTNLSAVSRVWVPRVHLELCRESCIVMEYIPNLAMDATDGCAPAVRRRLGVSALTTIYHMLFVDGFVHCDMHPGNLYFTPGGQTVVLDAGFSVRLTDRLRRLFAEFFMNMAIGRGRYAAGVVVESSLDVGPESDVDGFITRMADLVERSHGLPAKEFSLVGFATEMFDLQRRHGVHAAPEIVFPLLALLVIEGTIRDLAPDIDFQESAKPVLMEGLFGAR